MSNEALAPTLEPRVRQLRTSAALRARSALLVLAAALVAAMLLAATLGAHELHVSEIIAVLRAELGLNGAGEAAVNTVDRAVLMSVRLPRIVFSALVGAALALAGVAVQAVFRNPLAAPDIIGTSGGAACAAALTMALGVTIPLLAHPLALPISAFVGGVVATGLIYLAARRPEGVSVPVMLLAGIAVNALAFSVVGLCVALVDEAQLRSLNTWMLGSLASATWSSVRIVLVSLLAGYLVLRLMPRDLDLFSLGEQEARASGVHTERTKRLVIVLACGLSGVTVAFTGMIGFVGLVVPHMMRLVVGARHRWLLPAAMLAGALLLVLSDTVARTIIDPRELPVGTITALVGAPAFLFALVRMAARRALWL